MASFIGGEKGNVLLKIAAKLEELGRLLDAAGDKEVGQHLQTASKSHDLPSLRNFLLQKSTRERNTQTGREKLWLEDWVSKESKDKLSDEQISKVSLVVQHWARYDKGTAQLEKDALAWCKAPSSFCGTRFNSFDPISFYFQEFENIEKAPRLNRVRRKIVLLNTFLAIEKEVQHLRCAKAMKQIEKIEQIDSQRKKGESHRSIGISTIARRIWGHENLSPSEYKRRRDKLSRMSRYGQKWSCIKPRSLILGLEGRPQDFEQKKWSDVEIKAINAYLKTRPIYDLRSVFEEALGAINKEWSRHMFSRMETSTIPQIPNHIASHVSVEVQPSINLLADEAFRSAEKPERVAGLAEEPQQSHTDDTMTVDPSTDFGAFGIAVDPVADFMDSYINVDPSSDYVFLDQNPHLQANA